ncbi:hypothetical protein PF005_g18863 [Phytophthora fragariae]|uniref:Uncharacterized protein n=1 Tax=Phytophthora fragariae TaxID=53985 RepID=A0A6A3SQV8_9STRA|nr:hypothetical protein PF009_g15057 [Phytophthora fragariae]KAE9002275.1 hypothetical protein PF011_g13375 [Phytophthora fragariae]KAE9091093.1 hypothetical protein PF010_g18320 [Phytophthora fragariae]KAE9102648.1 hypothetical protein PF007_g14684 [Phytophthora fragariae]KAE9121975.1 hypothetical protein PF006_g17764 [Phytophthora fragariae]
MNQLEAPVARDPRTHLAVAAESASLGLPPAPSAVLVKGVKQLDRPEVDHEGDEQSQQERLSRRAGHDGDYSGNQHGPNGSSDDACEPMVTYDGFETLGQSFDLPRFDDGDEDVVNVRSPIICKPASSRSATLSPTCVSALARDEVVHGDDPSWTIQEFREYLGMLDLLQEVCSSSEGGEMCLSADSLGQMERLLTSLLPQGA